MVGGQLGLEGTSRADGGYDVYKYVIKKISICVLVTGLE